MNGLIHSSLYFGMLVSVGAYMLGVWLKKKTGWAILNPLLVAIIVVIAFLSVFHIEYKEYNRGAVYLGYFLTPATVCLAIPLYKQLELLRQHLIAVASAIVAGVAGSVGSIYVMCRFFQLEHTHYVTLLPKSITTAIGMGVSEEAGGIVTLTVISIIITGILGNIIADWLFQIFKIEEPIREGSGTWNSSPCDWNGKGAGIRRDRGCDEQLVNCGRRSFDRSGSTTDVGTDLKVVLKRSEFV